MKHLPLTERQAEVATRIAHGLSYKEIAAELGLSVETVRVHVRDAAERVPGDSWPRHRLTLWFFNASEEG